MNELEAMRMTAEIADRVTARPRDYLERIENAARRLVEARRRCDELEARRELTHLLTDNPCLAKRAARQAPGPIIP